MNFILEFLSPSLTPIVTVILGILMVILGTTIFGSLFGQLFEETYPPPCIMGDPTILMSKKEHGTSHTPVQKNLLYNVDEKMADYICNFNRHDAEPSGYFYSSTTFLEDMKGMEEITFYDSNTGKALFIAPKGDNRSMQNFLDESYKHGWPSFRDEEVVWENVRVLPDGETVSVDGTHLGHNLPDRKGSRYCINLVSISGNPVCEDAKADK